MEAAFYEKLMARAKSFPMFVLPLPRDDGYELFLMQFAGHQIFYTTLADYQKNKEGARPHLIVTHYPELKQDKQVVLMVGEVAVENAIKLSDAQNLVYQTQLFYVTGKPEQTHLVEKFWLNPGSFDYNELIEALAKLG